MNTLTVKLIDNYLTENYGGARHCVKTIKKACDIIAKEYEYTPIDIFYLIIENKPIEGSYTHSYGFHTRHGRDIINTFKNTYYSILS